MLYDLIGFWERMIDADRKVLLRVAEGLANDWDLPDFEPPPNHPTRTVVLPHTTAEATFTEPRICPDCGVDINPPEPDRPASFCHECGCPLPVWEWST